MSVRFFSIGASPRSLLHAFPNRHGCLHALSQGGARVYLFEDACMRVRSLGTRVCNRLRRVDFCVSLPLVVFASLWGSTEVVLALPSLASGYFG